MRTWQVSKTNVLCKNKQLFAKNSVLDIWHGPEYTFVFQIEEKFSFQKTLLKVIGKDFDIIIHVTNAITNRVFDWDWKNI